MLQMGLLDIFRTKTSIEGSGVLKGTADRHTHILFGVDDGVRTVEESLEVLEYEESLGVTDVWCTPHVMEDVPNSTAFLKSRFEELVLRYDGPVRLHLAAEYMLDNLFAERLESDDLLLMEDNRLLVETSTVMPPYDLKGMLGDAMRKGYAPVFAHPERCRFLEVKDVEELHSMGVMFQLNLASLTGYYGETARKKAEMILQKYLYSFYGSDCHRMKVMRAQYERPVLKNNIVKLVASFSFSGGGIR